MYLALSVLGIPDPWIWMAYLLCLAATALCVVRAVFYARREEEPTPADTAWAAQEKVIEEEE